MVWSFNTRLPGRNTVQARMDLLVNDPGRVGEPNDPLRAATRTPTRNHLRRLRQYYRSSGWPCHDNIEIDLLEQGLVRREATPGRLGLEAIVVTDAGIAMLAQFLEANRRLHAEHDALVDRVARYLVTQKRLVFRGVGLRTYLDDAWALSRPDVFSVRHVTSSRRLHPAVHEIKVNRADLLGDLKKESKRRGYQSFSQSFYYVIAEGIAEPCEIPVDCGVIIALRDQLRLVRPAPHRAARLTTAQWIALARTGAEFGHDDDSQLAF
jgi:hypothetical protein